MAKSARKINAHKSTPILTWRDAAIAAIRKESARVGWPTSFATDLDHDENSINADPEGMAFGWILRPTGTHICAITRDRVRGYAGSEYYAHTMPCRFARCVADSFGHEMPLYYLWDGIALIPCANANELDERMTAILYPDAEGAE